MTLRTRIIVVVAVTCTLSLLATLAVASMFLHSSNETHFQQRMSIVTRIIAANLTEAVVAHDLALIDETAKAVIAAQDGMIRICVFDAQGNRLSTCRCHSLAEEPYPGEEIFEAPIEVAGIVVGSVGVAFDTRGIMKDVALLERQLFLLAFGLLGLALLFAWLTGDSLSRQLDALVVQMSRPDPVPIPLLGRRSDLDKVAQAFNALLERHGGSSATDLRR